MFQVLFAYISKILQSCRWPYNIKRSKDLYFETYFLHYSTGWRGIRFFFHNKKLHYIDVLRNFKCIKKDRVSYHFKFTLKICFHFYLCQFSFFCEKHRHEEIFILDIDFNNFSLMALSSNQEKSTKRDGNRNLIQSTCTIYVLYDVEGVFLQLLIHMVY